MIDRDWQWVIPGDLIPRYNLETWYEDSEEWKLPQSKIWHYGLSDTYMDKVQTT